MTLAPAVAVKNIKNVVGQINKISNPKKYAF